MKSNFKKLPGSQIELEVSLDANELQPYWQAAHDKALASVELKGFRPGTAPRELAEQAIDKEKVFEEAVHNAVRSTLDTIVQEHAWTIIDTPHIEIADTQKGLNYKSTLTIFPEIELGSYKKIAKKALAEKKEIKVEPAEIEKSLEWLRNSRARIIRVSRPAKTGDLVDLDVESFVDHQSIKDAQLKHDRFVLGNSRFVPGFDGNIEHHKEGDVFSFIIKASNDYWNQELRGKNVEFKVRLHGVFERELPELNDEFAKGLGKFTSLDALRASISEGIFAEKESKELDRLRLKMLDEIIKNSEIDIPEIMAQKTLDQMVAEFKNVTHPQKVTDEELRQKLHDKAKHNVASNLVIYKIAEVEKLQPTTEEVEAEARLHNLDIQKFYDYSYGVVLNRKVFGFLESL